MGVRYFCDRCEKEFKSGGLKMSVYARDAFGTKIVCMGEGLLCEACTKKFDMVKDRLKYEEDFFTMTDDDISMPTSDYLVVSFDNASMDAACMVVARNEGGSIKVITTFRGKDALKEYKNLVGKK